MGACTKVDRPQRTPMIYGPMDVSEVGGYMLLRNDRNSSRARCRCTHAITSL